MIDVDERLRSALHEIVPLDSRRDWDQVIAGAGVAHESAQSNRRRLIVILVATAVLAVVVATPAFGVRGALLDLFGRSDVPFTAAPPAASVIKREFADMSSGAPKGMDPRVSPGEARLAATLDFGGVKRHVWVAPTETGGFCYLIEGLSGGCTEIKTDPLILDGGFVARPGATTPAMESLAGRIYSAHAAQLRVAFEDGRTMVLPFVYVSEPIGAGFFAYKPTPAEERPGHRPLAIVVADAEGAEVGRETINWEREDAKLQRILDALKERTNQTRPATTTGQP